MATGTKAAKRRGKKISVTTTAMRQDAITEMALANGARLDRGTFVVADMPNPHGEVIAGGKPVAHKTVKRQPQYELLRKRRVISDEMAEALAWYEDRRALAESGMIRNPLAGNGGGGDAGSGIPITEARMAAVRDVDWARHQITADLAPLTARLAGAIELREMDGKVQGIAFRCPCGCGYTSWLPVQREERGWDWDGNREAPTLTPSILQSGLPCKWHGYLTAGVFRPC